MNSGSQRKRARNADALALAAATSRADSGRRSSREADLRQQLAHALARACRSGSSCGRSMRLGDDVADRHARIERAVRVLEDHLDAPAQRAQRSPRRACVEVDAVEQDLARRSAARAAGCSGPIVVLPQPDSPTRPSVSPRRMSKLTPSTALTSPTVARNSAPSVDREVHLRPRTSSSDVALRPARRLPAHRRVVVPTLMRSLPISRQPAFSQQAECCPPPTGSSSGGGLGAARYGEAAARHEGAAGGEPRQVGRLTLDRRRAAPCAAGPGAGPSAAAPSV